MCAGALQHTEHDGYFHGRRHGNGGLHRLYVVFAFRRVICLVEIFFVEHADDGVHGAVVYGQARITALAEYVRHLVRSLGIFDRGHVDARNHDVAYFQIVELDRVLYEAGFVHVKLALALRRFHYGDEFLFGYALGIAEFEHFAEQSLPALEKHIITAYQKWIERFRYLLGTVPRQRFGRNFAEYEHDDGGHYGGKHVRERFVADDERHEQHGRYRGERYVDDVVAYKHGGQQVVVSVQQSERLAGAHVAVRVHGAQAYLACGRIGCFARRKTRRQDEQYRHRQQQPVYAEIDGRSGHVAGAYHIR